jgi:hypothetical protein
MQSTYGLPSSSRYGSASNSRPDSISSATQGWAPMCTATTFSGSRSNSSMASSRSISVTVTVRSAVRTERGTVKRR